MAYREDRNPFSTDYVDDETFLKGGVNRDSPRQGGGSAGYDFGDDPPPSRYDQLQQLKQQSMNRQLDSTQRCLASIYDSEAVGVATAEELVRQGEQLDNIECKVEKINADTRQSQRHLNGIKSIFGGLRNWWQGDGKNDGTINSPTPRNTALRQTIDSSSVSSKDNSSHPAMRLKGFYDDDVQSFDSGKPAGSYMSGGRDSSGGANDKSRAGYSDRGLRDRNEAGFSDQGYKQQTQRSAEFQEYEENLNKNLDAMSGGLSQLKLLARGLGDEIETQNEQIDRIAPKIDRADTKIRDQNRQMKKILGK